MSVDVPGCDRIIVGLNIARLSPCNNPSSMAAGSRPKITEIITAVDHLTVMLNDQQRIA